MASYYLSFSFSVATYISPVVISQFHSLLFLDVLEDVLSQEGRGLQEKVEK